MSILRAHRRRACSLSMLLCAALLQACATAPRPPVDPARSADLVLGALNFVDVDYKWGGNSAEEGFDCSGFTRHVYQTLGGIALPRRSEEQANAPGLRSIPMRDLSPGDLVFFNTLRRSYSHVGIYVGEGRFVHAPRTGARVRVESMRSSYWANRFDGARRPEQL